MTNAKTYLVIRNSSDQYVVNDTFKDENFKDVCNFVVILYSDKQAAYLADHSVNAKALADVEPSELHTFEMSCTFDVLCNSTKEAMYALDAFKKQHANDNVLARDKVDGHNGYVMFMYMAEAMKAVLQKHKDMIKVNMWCLFKYGHDCYAWKSCLDAVCTSRSKIFTDESYSIVDDSEHCKDRNISTQQLGVIAQQLREQKSDENFCSALKNNNVMYKGFTSAYTVYALADDNSNVFIWKTASTLVCDIESDTNNAVYRRVACPRSRVFVKGTVSAHTEYKGVKQTKLTRCKCFSVSNS